MSLPRAARRGLAEESADRIRDAIFAGHFPPGAPLREVDLAKDLDVSRGSVREGLALLEREGLVHSAWHRGTTVIEVTPRDVEEVYTVRAALDRLAATTASTMASGDDLAKLDEIVERMITEIDSGGPHLLALDIAFHDAVYAASGNGRLIQAWQAVRSQVYLFQLRRIAVSQHEYLAHVTGEHRELAELIRGDKPDVLARVAEEHVHSARRALLAHLNKAVSAPG
jgi:DNA-binding GntR family transcriptional regulator